MTWNDELSPVAPLPSRRMRIAFLLTINLVTLALAIAGLREVLR